MADPTTAELAELAEWVRAEGEAAQPTRSTPELLLHKRLEEMEGLVAAATARAERAERALAEQGGAGA